mgnify:CR=1 FL=1
MDQIDREIMNMLQKNARIPLKAIAQEVHLSIPAVSARVERLERENVICGYTMIADPVKMGYHITAFINMELKPEQKDGFCKFIRGVSECGRVQSYYRSLLYVDQSTVPKYHGIRRFVGTPYRIWKDTDTDRIFFDCKCKEYRSA